MHLKIGLNKNKNMTKETLFPFTWKGWDKQDELMNSYLMDLHYKCKEYLDAKKYEEFVEFLKTFDKEDVDVNELKTISIITKGPFFNNHTILSPILKKLDEIFETKMKEYNNGKVYIPKKII